MSLETFSVFYYGQEVTSFSFAFDFNEGAGELQATIPIGSYTLSEIATELQTQLNSVGTLTYQVTVNRVTRVITISADGNFSILRGTGTRAGQGVYPVIGFSGSTDLSGSSSYVADGPSGSEYRPQFILQDHVSTDNQREFIDPSINEAASGEQEIIRFGTRRFLDCNIKFSTNIFQPSGAPILNQANGVANLRAFMEYATEKLKIEYMPDVNTRGTFEKLILESTPESRDGTNFKLKEMYSMNLAGYFETGVLRFRKVL